jgi:hypothetical protein
MAIEELKIKQKCEDMIQYAYIAIRQFPKSEKFSLATDIKVSMLCMLKLIIKCNKSRNKTPYLYEIDVELDILRSLVRLSKDLGFLPFKKYEVWAKHIDEIGKMLGGWIKHVRGKAA